MSFLLCQILNNPPGSARDAMYTVTIDPYLV